MCHQHPFATAPTGCRQSCGQRSRRGGRWPSSKGADHVTITVKFYEDRLILESRASKSGGTSDLSFAWSCAFPDGRMTLRRFGRAAGKVHLAHGRQCTALHEHPKFVSVSRGRSLSSRSERHSRIAPLLPQCEPQAPRPFELIFSRTRRRESLLKATRWFSRRSLQHKYNQDEKHRVFPTAAHLISYFKRQFYWLKRIERRQQGSERRRSAASVKSAKGRLSSSSSTTGLPTAPAASLPPAPASSANASPQQHYMPPSCSNHTRYGYERNDFIRFICFCLWRSFRVASVKHFNFSQKISSSSSARPAVPLPPVAALFPELLNEGTGAAKNLATLLLRLRKLPVLLRSASERSVGLAHRHLKV